MTVDPNQTTASTKNPQSWNRYAYANGDPVNRNDPRGTDSCVVSQGWAGNGDPLFYADCGYDDYLDYSSSINPGTYMSCMSDPVCYGSHGGGGSGGGGYIEINPQQTKRGFKPPYEQMTNQQEQFDLKQATDIFNALMNDPDCRGLFSGGPDPTTVLAGLEAGNSSYGLLGFGPLNDLSHIAEATNSPGTTFILLNDNVYGPFANEDPLEQAQTLIHELGHLYYNVFGAKSTAIKPDSSRGDPKYSQGQRNIDKVAAKCSHIP